MQRAPGNENVILGGRMTGRQGGQPRLSKGANSSSDGENTTLTNQTTNTQNISNTQNFNVENNLNVEVLMPIIQQEVQSGSFAAIANVLSELINAMARLENQGDTHNTRITNTEEVVEGFEKGQNVKTIREIANGINRDRVALEKVSVWVPYRGE